MKVCCILLKTVVWRVGYQGTSEFRVLLEAAEAQVKPIVLADIVTPGT